MTESRLDYLKGLLGEPNVTWGSETVGELLAEVERLRREIKGLESMIRGRPLPPEAERLFRAGLDSRPMPPEAERLFLAGLDSMAGGWAAKYEAERKAAEALRAEVARLRRDIANRDAILDTHKEAVRRVRRCLERAREDLRVLTAIDTALAVLDALNTFHPMHGESWQGWPEGSG